MNQQLRQVLLSYSNVMFGPQNKSMEYHFFIHHIQIVICKQPGNLISWHCNELLVVHDVNEMLLKTQVHRYPTNFILNHAMTITYL